MLIAHPESVQEVLVSAVRALGAKLDYRTARLEAELLLAHALGMSRAGVLARLADPLDSAQAARFAAMVARRAQNEPIAYILGHQSFFGVDLIVDRRVLIPRHETELLVELALGALKTAVHLQPVVVDVGTGSGAIAVALALHSTQARIIATDISEDALTVARLNARRLNLTDRIEFRLGDLLSVVDEQVDILVANLPYIPEARFGQLPREIRHYEPAVALLGGPDGLDVMRSLLRQMQAHMARTGVALLEISEEQGSSARPAVEEALPRASIQIIQDLEGLDRVMQIKLAGE